LIAGTVDRDTERSAQAGHCGQADRVEVPAAGVVEDQQRADGSWIDMMMGQHGGISALCTLALLNSGVEPGDEAMQRALAFLRRIQPEKTYVVSLQTMVFARAEPEKHLLLIRRNVKWLEKVQTVEGRNKGAWSYPYLGGTTGDNSNSQFALLALYEAERVGVVANERTWQLAKKYWEDGQNKEDGSWGYTKTDNRGTGSMTCAGISALVIAADETQVGGLVQAGLELLPMKSPIPETGRVHRPQHGAADRKGDRSGGRGTTGAGSYGSRQGGAAGCQNAGGISRHAGGGADGHRLRLSIDPT